MNEFDKEKNNLNEDENKIDALELDIKDDIIENNIEHELHEIDENIDNNTKNNKKKSSFIKEWVLPILSAVVLATLINKFVIFKVYIPSESMVPTLNVDDRLLVTKVYNVDNLEREDIVVFKSEELNEVVIKRLIGLPGDKIEIKNGEVSVNGEKLAQEYVKNKDNFYGEFTVPEGEFFFLGDNRPISFDSRKWIKPTIKAEDIMGKAQIKIYPFSDFGWVK